MKRSTKCKLPDATALATIETVRPNRNTVAKDIPCRIVGDKLYTLTRTFSLETMRKIDGIKGDAECNLLSYTLI